MATITTGRTELNPILDPRLFTFKPKLNQKSNEIAQNLLSDFYERQMQHVKRLEEFKAVAANNYRSWYCQEKRSKNSNENSKLNSEIKSPSNDVSLNEEAEPASVPIKEANQPNERIARMIRIYRTPLPRRPGMPNVSTNSRVMAPIVNAPPTRVYSRSAGSSTTTTLPPPPATAPAPVIPPAPQVLAPVHVRLSRRVSPTIRSKSPQKVVRQADPSPKRPIINDTINIERLKLARDEAERAVRDHKIFTIIGPYPALREALRRRGWIEKFDRALLFPNVRGNRKSDKKNNKSDDDDDNDDDNDDELGDDDLDENAADDDEDKIQPWEENDGYYGLLSRLVKSTPPDFIWSVQASYDTSTLNKDQMVNHYSRNGCFTTKVGLCNSLRNLPWFYSGCADEFYPRCYKLTHDDDKIAFIDDYRLTSCISFLKLIHNRLNGIMEPDMNSILQMSSDNQKGPQVNAADDNELTRSNTLLVDPVLTKSLVGKSNPIKKVSSSEIEFALTKVEEFTLACDHEDIDINLNSQEETTDEQWTHFIEQFYIASHSFGEIENMEKYSSRIDTCLKNVESHWPQYQIDGTRNIWILKPGAKSRGRGIVVYDRLDDILKLCSSSLTNDRKFVVQKYIERPLLIHNIKFDIRQWFLVTDWNPLTIWMFKDCYLRFCTELFSLSTRQQNVHLCNYSIQKHYKNNANRNNELPEENMWTNTEFIDKYLRPRKLAEKWDSYIYPAMKDMIICSMLVAQDSIEPRKNSFELFGADFMLGEDLKPWLIEINCSPTMARSTAVTKDMCDGVLEDTCKIMIDKRYNRSTDTGRFELIYKGNPVPVPNYVGIDLRVEGKTYKPNRTTNNNYSNTNTTNNSQKLNIPISAPVVSSKSSDLVSDIPLQSFSVCDEHNDSARSIKDSNDATLSPDIVQEKSNDYKYIFQPNHKNASPSKQTNDIRRKQNKNNSNRITIDSLPIQRLSRSKINDRIPSPKGNRYQTVSKINVAEFFTPGQENAQSNSFPMFRRFKQSHPVYKFQEKDTNNSSKSEQQTNQNLGTTSDISNILISTSLLPVEENDVNDQLTLITVP